MKPQPIETLPASWYTDSEVLAAERRTIFSENWILFGPEHDLANPGSYRADTINGQWPILVVRDAAGKLHAFHNVCRHRASMLTADGDSGQCKLIRCPYHGWTYRLDGSLHARSDFGDSGGLDADKHALFPVRIETWNGLVFVCLSDTAPDLMTWLGSIPELSTTYPAPNELEFHDSFVVEGEANWKTYCDNTVEGYHLALVHPRLTEVVNRNDISIKSYDEGRLTVFHIKYQGSDTSLRGAEGIWYYRFPGFAAVLGQTSFKVDRIEPVTASRQRSTSWGWYRQLSAQARRDAFAWAETIVREDLSICERVQRNLQAGIYDRGVLSPKHEQHTATFQALVRSAVENE